VVDGFLALVDFLSADIVMKFLDFFFVRDDCSYRSTSYPVLLSVAKNFILSAKNLWPIKIANST